MTAQFRGTEPQRPFAVVVLAARGHRGGKNPLRTYLGLSLVERAARSALASGAQEVVVVAGEQTAEIQRKLCHLPVRVVQNREWAEGHSSSIRAGISSLRCNPAAALICLCDQPKITAGHLRTLADRVLATGGPEISASSYGGVLGSPAAFDCSLFGKLLALTGPEGARNLIREASNSVETIEFDEADKRLDPLTISESPTPNCLTNPLAKLVLHTRDARAPPIPPHQPAFI